MTPTIRSTLTGIAMLITSIGSGITLHDQYHAITRPSPVGVWKLDKNASPGFMDETLTITENTISSINLSDPRFSNGPQPSHYNSILGTFTRTDPDTIGTLHYDITPASDAQHPDTLTIKFPGNWLATYHRVTP